MKILIYTAFPPVSGALLGGAQRYLDTLLAAFQNRHVDITVACPPATGRPLVAPTPRLRVVDRLQALVETGHAERVGPPEVHHDLRMLHRLASTVDVIVSIDEHFPIDVDVPVVLWLNNFSYPPETRSVFGCSWDAVVVPSDYVRRCLTWYLPPESRRERNPGIHVIPPAVGPWPIAEPTHVSPPSDTCHLVFPHRADPDKGFRTALLAVRELVSRGKSVHLSVPETDPELMWPHQVQHAHERREMIDCYGLNDVVTVHPWVDASLIPTYLASAAWTLCPSELPESFGLTVTESLAAGTPVIATPAGATPELVPEGHGVELVEFGDWMAVAEIVSKGADNHAVERGRVYVARTYSPSRCADRWLRVLRETTRCRHRYVPPDLVEPPPWRRVLPSGRTWDDYAKRYADRDEVNR